MICTKIFLSLGLVAPILAQSNYTFPDGFDLGQVESTEKSGWCRGQLNNCPQVCGGSSKVNRCDSDTLEFTCTCSDGTEANVEEYQDTIPFYVCQANYKQCISHSSTQDGDDVCTAGMDKCGSKNASAPTTTSSSPSSSTTLSSETSGSSNGDQSGNEATATDSSDSSTPTDGAMSLMQNYGLAGFATVVVAAFTLL
ncbi:hypothetical protein ASPVEDRAFT_55286 [Aspergillus versicolor CBS 583.65]|uniref:DUF7707 domain-containing protein n=1 Tax=Aspergillus versicolor CBS 583.65 TaxID=1036611 RepID=A0A1L9PV89_ASPVE|nr:uncharacterized protein ASPVEDRAFT_55286 [Aspergillus versicolor CBS 583.65]OJJ05383.1 hypothetical protein ASPVEDRAFT_55286 [Aspergillus versicolor CBS 583.65]